jgi:hypothetical protein
MSGLPVASGQRVAIRCERGSVRACPVMLNQAIGLRTYGEQVLKFFPDLLNPVFREVCVFSVNARSERSHFGGIGKAALGLCAMLSEL